MYAFEAYRNSLLIGASYQLRLKLEEALRMDITDENVSKLRQPSIDDVCLSRTRLPKSLQLRSR